ncbi:hypothetical protein ACQPZF_11210 [Actinosynnema sp. CS-041913]|uniref:hypothetical protein n=1 Tax=Actinosynnema sp. CS-041913 TaxID=3239917 RepID=UPI003D93A1A8
MRHLRSGRREFRVDGIRLVDLSEGGCGDLNAEYEHFLDHQTLLPANPSDAVRAGRIVRVPVLSGGNHEEARAFMAGAAKAMPDAITAQTYPQLVRTAFGDRAADVLAQYLLARFGTRVEAWSTVVTDAAWSCPTQAGNQALTRAMTVSCEDSPSGRTPGQRSHARERA